MIIFVTTLAVVALKASLQGMMGMASTAFQDFLLIVYANKMEPI
jgi:hypothetical protein